MSHFELKHHGNLRCSFREPFLRILLIEYVSWPFRQCCSGLSEIHGWRLIFEECPEWGVGNRISDVAGEKSGGKSMIRDSRRMASFQKWGFLVDSWQYGNGSEITLVAYTDRFSRYSNPRLSAEPQHQSPTLTSSVSLKTTILYLPIVWPSYRVVRVHIIQPTSFSVPLGACKRRLILQYI